MEYYYTAAGVFTATTCAIGPINLGVGLKFFALDQLSEWCSSSQTVFSGRPNLMENTAILISESPDLGASVTMEVAQ